jgi:hypothetical protein
MKKFVRGQFGRFLSTCLMVVMLVPSLLAPLSAASSGRQNILILPLPTNVGSAPLNLGGRIIQELQIALAQQVGVQVNELSRTSPILLRAREQAESDSEKTQLLEQYDKAVDPKSDPATRVDASAYLVKHLGVDAVVYGVIDQYEFTHGQDPNQVYIHVTATKVTVDKEDVALASPLVVMGKSHRRADGGGAQESHNTDAIITLAHNLANLLTGKGEKPATTTTPRPPKPVKPNTVSTSPTYQTNDTPEKPHGNFWKTAAIVGGGLLAVGAIGIIAANGKKSGQTSTVNTTSAVGSAIPLSDRIELRFAKPTNFAEIESYQILRAEIGAADTRGATRAAGAPVIVRTLSANQMLSEGNDLIAYDGPDSSPRPTNGTLYIYTMVEIGKNSRRTLKFFNSGLPGIETVGPHVPPPVSRLDLQMKGSSVVQLTWSFDCPVPTFISGYIIERRPVSGTWERVALINGRTVTTAQTSVPLPNVEYEFRVLPQSDNGSVFLTLPPTAYGKAIVQAGAPQEVDASTIVVRALPSTKNVGKKYIHVEWAIPTDTFVTRYTVERSETRRSRNYDATGPNGIKIPRQTTSRDNADPRTGRGRTGRGGNMDLRRDYASDTVVTRQMRDRTQNYYDDEAVEDGKIYTYTITSYAGDIPSTKPAVSTAFKMDFNPANVTTFTSLVTRGGLKFGFNAVNTKADGSTTIVAGSESAATYQIYRSTTFSATATTVKAVNINANTNKDSVYKYVPDPTYFTLVGSVGYNKTTEFSDTAVGTTLKPRTSNLSYVVILADTAGNTSFGPDYPVYHVTPMPKVKTDGVTISPTKMTVTAGSSTGQAITIQAMGEDDQLVPNVGIKVTCGPLGTLSTTATKPTGDVQTLDVDINGKDLVVTGKDGKARVYWFPPDEVVGSRDTTITAVEKLEPGSRAGTEPVPTNATVVIQEPVAQKIDLALYQEPGLQNPLTEAKVMTDVYVSAHVSDSSGANVSGKQVSLTCSDTSVTYPDGAASNVQTTNESGKATFHIKAGQRVGIITVAAICGSAIGQTRLSVIAGDPDPSKSSISMASATLAARDGATTAGTITVVDAYYNKVQGARVMLSTDLGGIDPVLVTTDSTGKAAFTYTATALTDPKLTEADAKIKAQIVGASAEVTPATVKLKVLGPKSITVSSNVTSIVAENDSQAIITATVSDEYGQPVVDGTVIDFTIDPAGVFQGSMTRSITTTTMSGKAIVIVLGTPATEAKILTVTAKAAKDATVLNSTTLLMQPRSEVTKILVTSDKDTAIVDNVLADRQCNLTILVTDAGKPVANTTVQIGVTAGSLSVETATTDVNGQVTGIVFTAPDKAQTVTITAKALNVTGATQITVRGGLPSLIEVSLSGPWALFNSNGRPVVMNPAAPYTAAGLMVDYETQVYARVTDEYGNPAPDGTTVFFEAVEPATYQMETVNTAYDDPNTHMPITTSVPKQHTGKPYGTIDPQASTTGGAATATLLSADRNKPLVSKDTKGAEILVRVNRADGRVVFSKSFRTAGPTQYQNRVLMTGGPSEANSTLTVTPSTYAVVGSPITINAKLNDDQNQPCAGNTPYQLQFTFEDGTQAAPPIVAGSDMVGELNNTVTITDLKGYSHRTITVKLLIPQQLLDLPMTKTVKDIPIIAGQPTGMQMTLESLIANGSTTQIYTYQQPQAPANGNLGPDQIRVVADGIVDQFGNPAFGEAVNDLTGNPIPTTEVVFRANRGGFAPDVDTAVSTTPLPTTVFTTIAGNKNVARAIAYYRCTTPTDDVIYATCGTSSSNKPIHLIGGATGVTFSFTRGAAPAKYVQVGADAGSNFDTATTTVTASANSKKIPASDAVSVYLQPDKGTFLNQAPMIALDGNSQIPNLTFSVDPAATGGPLNIDWISGKNGGTVTTGLTVIGAPDHFVADDKNTPGLAFTPDTIKGTGSAIVSGYLQAADGTPVLAGSITVQLATSNPSFVLTPANGRVVVGDKGFFSITVAAANPAQVLVNGFTVSARAGNATAQTGIINFGKSTKTLAVAVSGGAQTRPVDPNLDPKNINEAEVVISGLDESGNPVADTATVSVTNDAGAEFYASTDGGLTYTKKIGVTVSKMNFSNGAVTLHLRGSGAGTKPGVCKITASAENGTVTASDSSITYIGRPAKLTALTLTPKDKQTITLLANVKVQVDDVNSKPVYDGYPITISATGDVNVYGDDGMSLPGSNTASTSYGFAETNIVGNTAGASTVTARFGGVSVNAAYKFEGSGAITFTFAPNPPRILADGTKKIDLTVNGFLPDGKTAVSDGTPITLTLTKGYFGNGQKSIAGTFSNGKFDATITGAVTPAVADLGEDTLTAVSGAYKATAPIALYGQPTNILITDPPAVDAVTKPTVIAVAGTNASTTIEISDIGSNASDGRVLVEVIDDTTKITVSSTTVTATNGTVTTTVATPMVGKYLVKASLVNDKTKTDDFWLQSVASIPKTVTVTPAGTNPMASADGTGVAQTFTITALDAAGKPAGNIPAQVWIDRGAIIDNTGNPVIANDQATAVTVKLDATGTATFRANGAVIAGTPVTPGVATVTVQIGTLIPVTSTFRLIGKPDTIQLTADYYRLLANNRDQITVTAKVYDSAMQRVMDGTNVRFTVKNWDGTAVTPGTTRFTPSTINTVDGTCTTLFALKALGDVKITASADGYIGTVPGDLTKVTGAGADSVNIDFNTGSPLRISTDGTGPSGANSTDLLITATATDSKGNALTFNDPNLIGLPVKVTTTAGTLGTKGLTYDTTLDATGKALVTLAGTAKTTPSTATVSATSGAVSAQNPVSVIFVGSADPAKFTTTYIPTLTDSNNNKIVDIYQDATTSFQIEVTATDSADQPVLDGTVMTIKATDGLTITMPDTKTAAGDTGKVRWQLSPATSGLKDIFLTAGDVKKTDPLELEVLPVAKSFTMTILEQDRIYFDPASGGNLPVKTSFQLTGYQGDVPTPGLEQADADVLLTTDMGKFEAGQNVTLTAGKNGTEAQVHLNQAGQAVVHITGDSTNVGQPNIRVRSSGASQSINTGATPVRFVGLPYRIITQAYSKSAPTKTDDLRVMQDDPVTIIAEVQDKAGQQVLDGFMVKFSVNNAAAILRATNAQISSGVVRADLASNTSGIYTVTAEALDATGKSIAPTAVTDTTQVMIRTYAKTFTLVTVEPATARISQDGTETARITVLGKDANNTPILAGTPVQFTILQQDSELATLVDPLNQGNYGDIQNTVAEDGGTAMIFLRGQNIAGKVGTAGIRVASYNTGNGSTAAFETAMPDLITLYGPGSTVAGKATLAADMAPNPVTPGTEGTLAISLTDAVTGRAYNPSWYTLDVKEQAGVGTLTGVQALDTATGACDLTYTLTEQEATDKLAGPDPVLHFIVEVKGNTTETSGVLWTKTVDVTITNPATWPGHTEPAATYALDSVITSLNLGTEEQIDLHVIDAAGNPVGPGREIDAAISAGGQVRDAALPAPGDTTATLTTGAGGTLSLIVTAPAQLPAGGKITVTLTDKVTGAVITLDGNPAVTGIDVTVLNAKPVADFKLVTVANPLRLYYDPTPANQIINGLPVKTTVTLQGTTTVGGTEGSAGAMVNISVDRGQFRQFGVGAYGKTLNNVALDTNGQIRLEFQGAGEDTLLGMPTFTMTDSNNKVTRQLSQATLLLVGKPAAVTVALANSSIFQNTEAPVTATMTDANGQPVLDGWKIKYTQTSDVWTLTDNPADWKKTKAPGVFRLAANNIAAIVNGQSTTTFASNYSGVYTIAVSPKTSTLAEDLANAGVEVYGAGGVSDATDLTVNTYARNYTVNVVSPAPARIAADGSQIASLYVTCKDADGKRVLENVPVDVTPTLGRLLMADDTTTWVDSKTGTSMQVLTDANGQLRLLSRGNDITGTLQLSINNDQQPTAYTSVVDTGLVHYGVDVATATFTVTPESLTTDTQRLAGSDQYGNAGLAKSLTFTVDVRDAGGNAYLNGYTLTLLANGAAVGTPVPLTNSQAAFTFSYPLGAADKLLLPITAKLIGPDSVADNSTITSPLLFNVAVVKPKTATITPDATTPIQLDYNQTREIGATIQDAGIPAEPAQTLIPNFEIRYAVKPLLGTTNATLTANGGPFFTDANGQSAVFITSGTTPAKVQVVAYYDADRNGQRAANGSEDLGSSGDVFIGKPDALTPTNYTVPVNTANVVMTQTVSTGGLPTFKGYPVTCVLNGAGTLVASDATVGDNGAVAFTYTAPATIPAVDPTVQIRDAINNTVIGTVTLKIVTVTTIPADPTGFTAEVTGATSVKLTWNDVAQEETYEIQQSDDNVTFTNLAPAVPMNQTQYTDSTIPQHFTQRYYRLRAVNSLGNSNWVTLPTGVITGDAGPVLSDIHHWNDVTSSTVTLTWTDIDRETGYEIQRSWDGVTNWTTVATTGINITTTTVAVTPNSHNYYRVRGVGDLRPTPAFIEYGSWSNGADTNVPPAKAGAVTATALSTTQLQLTWDPVLLAGGYDVQYRVLNAATWTLAKNVPTTNVAGKLTYTITGLAQNTTYEVAVRAGTQPVGADLWYRGDWSDIATGTTNPLPTVAPGALTTTANGTTITVSWTDINGETGYELQSRKQGDAWPAFGAGTVVAGDATTVDVAGLLAGTTYEFRLRGDNLVTTAINAAWSPVKAQITVADAPVLAAVDPLVDIDGVNVTLRWAVVTGANTYVLARSPDGGATWTTVKSDITTLNYTDTAPALNTAYAYRLLARNAAGDSTWSNTQAITTGPAAPTTLTAVAAGTTVVLNWTNVIGMQYKLQKRTGLNPYADVAGVLLTANITTYTDGALATNTTYDYRIAAINSVGSRSTYTVALNNTTGPVAAFNLNAPTSVTDTTLTLTWDNVANASGYELYRWLSGTAQPNTPTATFGTVTTANQTGLIAGATINFCIAAVTAAGRTYSNIQVVTMVPPMPAGFSATFAGTTATLKWTDGLGETKYQYQQRTVVAGVPGAWSAPVDVPMDTTGTSVTLDVTGLSNGTNYDFQMCAANANGNSSWTASANGWTVPAAPMINPVTPATDVQGNSVTLSWAAVTGATMYYLERSNDGGNTWTTTVTVNGLTYNDTSMAPNAQFLYRLSAHGAGGTSTPSATVTVTTGKSASPSGLSAVADGTTVSVSWNLVAGFGYRLDRQKIGSPWTIVQANLPANVTTYIDTDVAITANTSYNYRLAAVDPGTGALSAFTDPVLVTTGPTATFSPLAATAVTATTLTVNWPNVLNETGYDIYRWPITGTAPGTKLNGAMLAADVTSYNDTGLTSGQSYYYRAVVYTAGGKTTSSPAFMVTTVPPTPQGFTATATDTTVTLDWTDGIGEANYEYQERTVVGGVAGAWGVSVVVPADTATLDIIGQIADTNYEYRFRAVNANGSSNWTTVAAASTIPAVPANFTLTMDEDPAIAASHTPKLIATWTDTNAETSYQWQVSTDGVTFGNSTSVAANTATFNETGFNGPQTRYYRVRAVNAAGTSTWSAVKQIVTGPAYNTTAENDTLTILSSTTSSVTLRWNDADMENGYEIWMSENGVQGSWNQVGSTAANVTTITISGLTPNEHHWFRVRAFTKTAGQPNGYAGWTIKRDQNTAPDKVIGPLPAKPVLPTAVGQTPTEMLLTWSPADGAETYRIQYRLLNATNWTTVPNPTFGLDANGNITFTQTGLVAGTTYQYQVRALNGYDIATAQYYGLGDWSDIFQGTTLPTQTPPITTFDVDAKSSVYRIYYSAVAADQLADNLPTYTDLVYTGYTTGTTRAAGAQVTITTNKGYFVDNTTAIPQYVKSYTTTLDSLGQATLRFQGWYTNPGGNNTALELPTLADLGTPSITVKDKDSNTVVPTTATAANNGWKTANVAKLIGTPYTIVQTDNATNDQLLQDADLTLTAAVRDLNGEPVLANMTVWFVQSYTPWSDPKTPANAEAKDQGNIRVPYALTAADGTATTLFKSNHSGLYTISSYALTKSNYKADLDQVKNLSQPGAINYAQYLLPQTGPGTVVTSSTNVLVQTYAFVGTTPNGNGANWQIVSKTYDRINCDGTMTSRVTFTAFDEDGKKVLPGVPFKVTTNRGKLELESGALVTATTTLYFNEKSEGYVISRGYPYVSSNPNNTTNPKVNGGVGMVTLTFDNIGHTPLNNHIIQNILAHYGPDVASAVNAGGGNNTAIWTQYQSGSSNPTTVTVAASDSNNNIEAARQVVFNFYLYDTFGNRYPDGYTILMKRNGVNYTSTSLVNGTASITYSEGTANSLTTTSTAISFTYSGEQSLAQGSTTFGTTPTVRFIRPISSSINPTSETAMSFNTNAANAYQIGCTVRDADNQQVVSGFEVRYRVQVQSGSFNGSLTSSTTNTSGSYSYTSLITGTSPCVIRVQAYYVYPGTGGETSLAVTPNIYIGIPDGAVANGTTNTYIDVPYNSGFNNYTIQLQSGGTNVAGGWPVTLTLAGVGSMNPASPYTTVVGGSGALTFAYSPGGTAGTTQIRIADSAPLPGINRTIFTFNAYGTPIQPMITGMTVTDATHVSINWTDQTNGATYPVLLRNETGFRIECQDVLGGAWTGIHTTTSTKVSLANYTQAITYNFAKGVTYRFRVVATNPAGESNSWNTWQPWPTPINP